MFDLHRFGGRRDELLAAKLGRLGEVDSELRAIENVLEQRQPVTVLREAGVLACLRCAAIHSSEDNYCPHCGLSVSPSAERPLSTAPEAQPGAAPAPAGRHGALSRAHGTPAHTCGACARPAANPACAAHVRASRTGPHPRAPSPAAGRRPKSRAGTSTPGSASIATSATPPAAARARARPPAPMASATPSTRMRSRTRCSRSLRRVRARTSRTQCFRPRRRSSQTGRRADAGDETARAAGTLER